MEMMPMPKIKYLKGEIKNSLSGNNTSFPKNKIKTIGKIIPPPKINIEKRNAQNNEDSE